MTAKKLIIIGLLLLFSPLLKIPLDVMILEPLGVYDIHVSRVPEGPHNCIKITEEWYRNCWSVREKSPSMPIEDDQEKSP